MRTRSLAHLTDVALVAEVERLARCERDATVVLVAHLAEMGARRWLFLGAGFPSLFEYFRSALALSEAEAYNRVVAARVVRRFPWVLDRLARGSINLTTLRLLGKYPTSENVLELVGAADGKSRREVERLLAARFPQAPLPTSIRKVPFRSAEASSPNEPVRATDRPRAGRETQPGTRHVPARVKRAVWVRDCARCAYVGSTGRRCADRGFLEFHHVQPFAAGGEATLENIALRGRAHNAYEADVFFGPMRVSEPAPTWGMSALQSHPVPERDVSKALSITAASDGAPFLGGSRKSRLSGKGTMASP